MAATAINKRSHFMIVSPKEPVSFFFFPDAHRRRARGIRRRESERAVESLRRHPASSKRLQTSLPFRPSEPGFEPLPPRRNADARRVRLPPAWETRAEALCRIASLPAQNVSWRCVGTFPRPPRAAVRPAFRTAGPLLYSSERVEAGGR